MEQNMPPSAPTPPQPPAPPVMPVMPPEPPSYPATLTIDYPDRPLNRVTSFFRIFVAIPILIILGLLVGPMYRSQPDNSRWMAQGAATGLVILPTVLMLLFRQKYPKWWYDWNMAFTRFNLRVGAYLTLLRDEYPSTDEEQAVHADTPYPDAKLLNRWLPLVKWFLVIPHIFILAFLGAGALFVVIIAWFAILFTGRYPRGMFGYVVGVMRWGFRVQAYAALLTTDRYPPFSLD